MDLITIKKNQYKGYSQRWNRINYDELINIPPGKYFLNGQQLIYALEIEKNKIYSPSVKHAYIIENNLQKGKG